MHNLQLDVATKTMRPYKLLAVLALFLGLTLNTNAESLLSLSRLSADTFGTYNRQSGDFGAGIGVGYAFTDYVELAADITSLSPTAVFVDNTHANLDLRLRLPLDSKYNILAPLRLSPYIYGGMGHCLVGSGWDTHAGAGLEFKVTDHINVFSDFRHTFANEEFLNTQGQDSFGVRAGLRFRF
jgi:hypothetical protein